ncbi:MAG: hypothetical protein K1X74_14905 [Pirellulales bacterium]|nr:hypothetical protein [Pirellulales bacterium]
MKKLAFLAVLGLVLVGNTLGCKPKEEGAAPATEPAPAAPAGGEAAPATPATP